MSEKPKQGNPCRAMGPLGFFYSSKLSAKTSLATSWHPLRATQVAPGGYEQRMYLREQQDEEGERQRQEGQRQSRATTDAMNLEACASDAYEKGLGYLLGAVQRAETAQTMSSGAEAKVGTPVSAYVVNIIKG